MEGPQLVRLGGQSLRILVVSLGQQDPDLPGQPLKKNAGEEVGLLLAPGTGLVACKCSQIGLGQGF